MKTKAAATTGNSNKDSALAMVARDVYWQKSGEFHQASSAGFEFEYAAQIYSVRLTGTGLEVRNIDGVVVVEGVA